MKIDLERRRNIAAQRGKIMTLNPALRTKVLKIRTKFNIPENGFQSGDEVLAWKKAYPSWTEIKVEIEKLRLSLGLAGGWTDRLEFYVIVNFLSAPFSTVSMTHNIESKTKYIKILDEPIYFEDIKAIYKIDKSVEKIPTLRRRLIVDPVTLSIIDLLSDEPGLSNDELLIRIDILMPPDKALTLKDIYDKRRSLMSTFEQ